MNFSALNFSPNGTQLMILMPLLSRLKMKMRTLAMIFSCWICLLIKRLVRVITGFNEDLYGNLIRMMKRKEVEEVSLFHKIHSEFLWVFSRYLNNHGIKFEAEEEWEKLEKKNPKKINKIREKKGE